MAGAGIINAGENTRNFIKLVSTDAESVVATVTAGADAAAKWSAIEAECQATADATGGELSDVMSNLPAFIGDPNNAEVFVFARNQAVSRPRASSAVSATISIPLYEPDNVLHRALRTAPKGQRINFVSVLIGDTTTDGALNTVADTTKATAESFFGFINVARPADRDANADGALELTLEISAVNPPVDQA